MSDHPPNECRRAFNKRYPAAERMDLTNGEQHHEVYLLYCGWEESWNHTHQEVEALVSELETLKKAWPSDSPAADMAAVAIILIRKRLGGDV